MAIIVFSLKDGSRNLRIHCSHAQFSTALFFSFFLFCSMSLLHLKITVRCLCGRPGGDRNLRREGEEGGGRGREEEATSNATLAVITKLMLL